MPIDIDAIRKRLADVSDPDRLKVEKHQDSDGRWSATLVWPDTPEAEIAEVYDFDQADLFANAAADVTDLLAEVDRLSAGIEKLIEGYSDATTELYRYDEARTEMCELIADDLRDLLTTGGAL